MHLSRATRWVAVLALASGCYSPQVATDVPCSPSGACPIGQMCISNLCVVDVTQPGDPDARKLDSADPDGRAPDGHPAGPCDPSAPFGAPVLVDGLNGTTYVANLRLSTDELEGFFQGMSGNHKQIYTATRPTIHDPFGAWTLMSINASNFDNYDVTLSADGVTLVFASPRSGGVGSIDIWRAIRPTPTSAFGAPSPITSVDTTMIEDQSYVMGNNAALWYTPTISGNNQEIYEAFPSGTDYAAGGPVTELNTSSLETFPTPNVDGTLIYFGSSRAGGQNRHIYVARRANAQLPFDAPTAVTELDSNTIDEPSWISPDLCRLYMSSTRLGQYNVFMAER